MYADDVGDYIRQGVPVVETSARLDELPEHDRFALGVGFEGGDFLMVRSAEEDRAWELPGGKVEEGETFTEAVKREFTEETGRVLVDAEACAVVTETYYSGNREKVVDGVVFSGDVGGRVREPEEKTEEVEFFKELPDELTRITFSRRTFERLIQAGRS